MPHGDRTDRSDERRPAKSVCRACPSPASSRVARGRGHVVSPAVAEPEASQVEVIEGLGLRWVNIERPRPATAPGSRSASTSTRSTTRTSSRATSARRSTSTTTTSSSSCYFPRFDKHVGRLNAAELDLFVGPDFVVTLPNEPLQPVEYLFERCRTNDELREQWFSKGTGYLLYKIVDACVDASLPDAREDGQQARADRGRDLRGPLEGGRARHLQRQAGDHQLPQDRAPAARRLHRPRAHEAGYLADDLDVYFDDINDASERVWQMLETYKETVEALEATNESVLSHRSTTCCAC